ncbi:hypothetical protein MAC_00658 [Metarhizium acridum CQMa 102]|uniref:Glycosyltransferase 2 n=1 Tax=Metarhizium acridum (strain CQMa 102) TaxID=655827 RepID=E9DSR0_METAQ|nr:uncharacterized protein MAC_00658 [Metarhizium acridum CQMa 102]EFY93420.1 hypothetical protein MAC_00658 [Metarhizium acridum CQMa 102]
MPASRGWHPRHLWPPWRHGNEISKKDDDLPLPSHSNRGRSYGTQWQSARMPRRTWVKRLAAYALVIVFLVYLFNRAYSPSSSALPGNRGDPDAVEAAYKQRFGPAGTAHVDGAPKKPSSPHQPSPAKVDGQQKGISSPKEPIDKGSKEGHNKPDSGRAKPPPKYDGPIRYPALASSLGAIASTGGNSPHNRNVLFAASSLKSSSTLLPMACEMAMEHLSYVHFAFIGTADIAMQDLLEVNGIDKTCPLILHDARPDHFQMSTENRMSLAIVKALHSTNAEESYFLRAVRDQVSSTKSALVELPERPRTSLAWISKLDSAALSAWNDVRFDILIHATPTGTANLERLLRSIARADFAGIQTPHITVELPYVLDAPLESYLASFKWPRPTPSDGHRPQMISLRRRITRQLMEEEDSSVRFVESFWPTDPQRSHVLVLASHTEVTPQFFQCSSPTLSVQYPPLVQFLTDWILDVKYSLLYQLHSNFALLEDYDAGLLGISLSVPTTLIDGTQPFTPPKPLRDDKDGSGETAFLWQRPNSEAMVFLGEKWAELHHFVAQTLYQKRSMSSTPALLAKKQVSKKYPAWLEYALRLSRLRGYFTLYPSRETAKAIIGVHSDVPDAPEEYLKDESRPKSPNDYSDKVDEDFDPVSPVDMLETLPRNGELQSPGHLPLLSWDGQAKTKDSFAKDAAEYTTLFRREVGECGEEYLKNPPIANKMAVDLFCTHKA